MTNTEQANSIGFQSAEQLGITISVLDRWVEEGHVQRMTIGRLKFYDVEKVRKIQAEQEPGGILVEATSLADEIDATRWTITDWCLDGKIKSAKKLRSPRNHGRLVWYANREEVVRYAAEREQRIAALPPAVAERAGVKPAEGVIPNLERIEAKLDAILAELGVLIKPAGA